MLSLGRPTYCFPFRNALLVTCKILSLSRPSPLFVFDSRSDSSQWEGGGDRHIQAVPV